MSKMIIQGIKSTFFLVCLLVLQSCNSDSTKNEKSQVQDEQIPAATASEDVCTSIELQHRTSKAEALDFIKNFWTNDSCVRYGSHFGAGIYLNIDSDNIGSYVAPIAGYSLFLCNGPDSIAYVVFKRDEICPGSLEPHTYISPMDSFGGGKYVVPAIPENARTGSALENYIASIKIPDTEINKDPAKPNAIQIIGDNLRYKRNVYNDGRFAKHGFGFIEKKQMEDFLAQKSGDDYVAGFIVMYGYSVEYAPDKIRTLLVPVNQNGYAQVNNNFYCLEKSWPPIKKQ